MDKDEKNLDFEDAKDLTIQDALRKHKEIEAGVTPDDNILDKYIKQHPEQVAAQKFSAKNVDYKDIDTSSLDSFIKRQREELEGKDRTNQASQTQVTATATASQGLVESPASTVEQSLTSTSTEESQAISQSETTQELAGTVPPIAPAPVTPVQSPLPVVEDEPAVEKVEVKVPSLEQANQEEDTTEAAPATEPTQEPTGTSSESESEQAHVAHLDLTDDDDDFFYEEDRRASRKKRVLVSSSVVVGLLALLGLGYGVNTWNQSSNTTVSSQSSQSSQDSDKKAYQDFQKSYQAFYVDANQTKLKNDHFDQLSDLEDEAKDLKGTAYYDDAQSDVKSLQKQINAIKTINGLFDKAVIEDGKLVEGVKVKADADFDNLSDDVLNTGNDTLDRLIEKAIRAGKNQLAKTKTTASSEAPAAQSSEAPVASAPASETPSQAPASSSSATPAPDANAASNPGTTQAAPAPTGPVYGGNIRQAGITNYTPSILQRNLSVVPYNASVVQNNVNSDAWVFAPGVLEDIIAKAQSRGYFAGNDFILEPVNINSKGQGFYNVYRTDGTYLFTINCKTGAWAGNAAGYSGPETLGWS